MKRTAMEEYEESYRAFSWEIPGSFNFGGDVVDQIETIILGTFSNEPQAG